MSDEIECRAGRRPPRDEYPEPSAQDLHEAIKAALDDGVGAHYRRGRYTATRTWTEHNPSTKPGEQHETIRVIECDRDIILNVPVEHAEGVLALIDSGGERIGFSAAVSESDFKKMEDAEEVTITDETEMGSMSEFDRFVSFTFIGGDDAE